MSITIGNRIKATRENNNISILELSIKTGIHKGKISQIEQGKTPISVKDIDCICQAMKISRKKLLPSSDN